MSHACWFKPKKFGYGATPSTWEGWAVKGVYGLVVWAGAATIITHRGSGLIVAISLLAAAVATIVDSVKKCEGHRGWNAGAKQISGKNG